MVSIVEGDRGIIKPQMIIRHQDRTAIVGPELLTVNVALMEGSSGVRRRITFFMDDQRTGQALGFMVEGYSPMHAGMDLNYVEKRQGLLRPSYHVIEPRPLDFLPEDELSTALMVGERLTETHLGRGEYLKACNVMDAFLIPAQQGLEDIQQLNLPYSKQAPKILKTSPLFNIPREKIPKGIVSILSETDVGKALKGVDDLNQEETMLLFQMIGCAMRINRQADIKTGTDVVRLQVKLMRKVVSDSQK